MAGNWIRRGTFIVATAFMITSAPVAAQDIMFGPTDEQAQEPKPVAPARPQAKAPAVGVDGVGPALTPPKLPKTPAPALLPIDQLSAATGPSPAIKARSSTSGMPPPPKPANCRNSGDFAGWLAAFKKEAASQGIKPSTIQSALGSVTLDQGIIARDRKQGIFSISFLDFSNKLATPGRVQNGRKQIKANAAAFARVDKEFGVQAPVITGFWALESDFGAGMGNLPIIRSLATLGYDCRRGEMFRAELMAALQIIQRGDMTANEMIGSWAGELGQTQFLPTRYLEHAIDYDGNGHPDLFRNSTDIIGSTANYMMHLGWRRGEPWLEEVRVTKSLPWDQADLDIRLPRKQWAEWGVTRPDGSALESDALPTALVLPMGRKGPAFLAYQNFDVYLQWNQSLNYAITAAYLATRIAGAPPMSKGSADIPVLSANDAKELQRLLAQRGFDVGEVDGRIGKKTRDAVKVVQKKLGLPQDSYPTPELLAALRDNS